MDDIDEAEAEMHEFLDQLDADPAFVETARSVWVLHFEMERQKRQLH
jgi:hypothetical protein